MRVAFEFEVDGFDIHATELVRLFLDIQHLITVSVALAQEELPEKGNEIVFDPYMRKYKWMVEAKAEDLGEADLIITYLRMESPLKIVGWLHKLSENSKDSFVQAFRYLVNHFFFVDLERERRNVEIQRLREEVFEKRIENATAFFNLVEKISDPILRQEFIDSLASSVLPFEREHPPIKSVAIIREEDK